MRPMVVVVIGFYGALGLLSIGLRLAGVLDAPWWLVLSPFWMPPAFVVTATAVVFVLMLMAFMVDSAVLGFRRLKRKEG